MIYQKQYKCIADLIRFAFSALILIIITSAPVITEANSFNYSLSFKTIYDDNILNYSDADLDQMDDSSATPNKFGIESKDDYIFSPELEMIYKTRLGGHSTHFGLKGTYYYYKENDIKRYYKIKLFIRRYINKNVFVQSSASYLPDYYYRNSYSSTEGYQEARFDKITFDIKLSAKLLKKISGNLYYIYSRKDFIPLFDERDIASHDFKVETIYRPNRLWKGWGSYTFRTAASAGADDPDYRRDTSYDSFLFTLGSKFYLKGLKGLGFELAGRINYKIVYFQTEKITSEDSYHLGRKDNRWSCNLNAKHEITSKLNLGFNFSKVVKKSDLPAEDLEKFLEYSSNSYYFILSYAF